MAISTINPNSLGGVPAFSAYQSSAQSLTAATVTKLQFQTKEFDTNNCFDNVTNYRFTPNVAGYYQVQGSFVVFAVNTQVYIAIYKNGTIFKSIGSGTTTGDRAGGSALIYMNGTTDYLEIYGFSGVTQNLVANSYSTYFQACLVRSA